MNKVFIFGDCHTARVWEHHEPSLHSNIDLKMWGKPGLKIWEIDFKQMIEEGLISAGVEAAVNQLNFETKIDFSEIKNADVVLPWLGYIDIRQLLPKYKNSWLIAKYYVDEIVKHFGDKKIIFIEPLPQFTEMLLKHPGISPEYTWEDRMQENDLFIKHLNENIKNHGLPAPITQKEIYEAVERDKFTTDMTHLKAHHPVDGLKDEYNKKIYNLFMKRINEFLEN
jgi:hypothetical protein